ncbi:MAG: tetratricopeptide repeat protein [Gracilimonas sp.]|nr:tetratricopeptide repeat protein [Gracilimonas sp.]
MLFQTQNYEGVLEEYEELYNKDPGNLDIALPYAQLLMARGKKEKASKIYEQLSKDQPDERRIYESLVDYYGNRQNIKAKRQALRKMQEQFPDDISLMKRIAQTYEQEDKWEYARAVYDTVKVMKGESKWLAISVAETYLREDSLNAADNIYEQALNNAPEDPELLRLRGKLQEKKEDWSAAENTYKMLVTVSDSSYGYSQLGKAQFKLGKRDYSYSNFNKAIENGSTDPETYFLLSKVYADRNEGERAFPSAVRALRMALQNVQELQNALTGKLEGNSDISALQGTEIEAQALGRNNKLAIDIFHFITSTFTEKKVMPLMQTLQKDYSQSGRLLMMIGKYYLEEELIQDGIALIKKSVRVSPNLEEAHKILGKYYSETDQKVKAIQAYERALSAAPQDKVAYMQLIELYRGIGKLNQLCDRWMAQYRANSNNQVLKESLIAALHKADCFDRCKKSDRRITTRKESIKENFGKFDLL